MLIYDLWKIAVTSIILITCGHNYSMITYYNRAFGIVNNQYKGNSKGQLMAIIFYKPFKYIPSYF